MTDEVKPTHKIERPKSHAKRNDNGNAGVEMRQLFVKEYLIDLNATAAAKRAGYSPKTAHSSGQRLLKHVEVAAAINKAMKERADRVEITGDRVLQELASVAFLRITDVVEWDDSGRATFKSSDKLLSIAKAGISEIQEKMTADGTRTVSLKLHNKLTALESLGKHLGLFPNKLQLSGDKNGEPVKVEGGLSDATVSKIRRVVLGIDEEEVT